MRGSLFTGGGSDPVYTGARRGAVPLITHFSRGSSIRGWGGLV